jgi:hypothetical protein
MHERTITIPYTIKGIEMHRTIETRELSDEEAKFLAGLFEVGGGINMAPTKVDHTNGRKAGSATPKGLIYYNDSDPKKIDFLAGIFGGKAGKHPGENSWRWIVYGYAASALLTQIKPYAPHRQEEMEAFNMVYDHNVNSQERLCIANALNAYTHVPKSYPNIDEYDHLKDDPSFLAGVFYGRGIDYSFNSNGSILRFWSQNPSVLAAVGEPYDLEPYAIVNENWPRRPEARIPVSFRLEMHSTAKADFLSRIQIPQAA